MSSYSKEPRLEPDSVYEPDAPPDTETYPEVVQRVREALYQAAEQGSEHYEGKPERLIQLLQCATAILNSPEIREQIAAGDYKGAADDVLWHIEYRFGKNFRRAALSMAGHPFFQDPNLVDLVAWLQRRECP